MPNITPDLGFTSRASLTITALCDHMTQAAPLVLQHLLRKSGDCFSSIPSGFLGDKSNDGHRNSQEALARTVCFHGFPGGRMQSGQGAGLVPAVLERMFGKRPFWSAVAAGLTEAKTACSSDSGLQRQRVSLAHLQGDASAATVSSYGSFC